MRNFLSLSLIIILLVSCYEKQEGCLDIRAENYDFAADEPCEDCCEFPTMTLSVDHEWGDTLLLSDSTYYNGLGDSIKIIEAGFYLSDISLLDGNGKVTVLEKMGITYTDGSTDTVPSNIALIQSIRSNYPVGSFDKAKVYDGLSFKIGIAEQYLSEELDDNVEYFDEATLTYTNFRMEYVLTQDTLVYELKGPEKTRAVTLSSFLDLPIGVNFTIPITVDYEALLRTVQIKSLQDGSQDELIIANLEEFFRL